MTHWDNTWLTMSQAATLLKCSKKTLYRRMATNSLDYKLGENNRRYISAKCVKNLSANCQQLTTNNNVNVNFDALLAALQLQQLEILRDLIVFLQPHEVKDISLKTYWLDQISCIADSLRKY